VEPGEHFSCTIGQSYDKWDPVPKATVRWRILDKQQVKKLWDNDGNNAGGFGPATRNRQWVVAGKGPHELRAESRTKPANRFGNVFEFEVVD